MAKKDDMKKKTAEELTKLLTDSRESLRAHRFEAAGARPKDTNILRKTRKTIARILTEQNARRANA